MRDGEQAPGYSMSWAQKRRIAQALAELDVDIIEAGFAQASDEDFVAVHAIAGDLRGPTVCALARCQFGDIEAAARALEPAQHPRIHVFIATSPLQREHKQAMSKCVRRVAPALISACRNQPVSALTVSDDATKNACVRLAKDLGLIVEPACGTALAPIYDNNPALAEANNIVAIVCGGMVVTLHQLSQWSLSSCFSDQESI